MLELLHECRDRGYLIHFWDSGQGYGCLLNEANPKKGKEVRIIIRADRDPEKAVRKALDEAALEVVLFD